MNKQRFWGLVIVFLIVFWIGIGFAIADDEKPHFPKPPPPRIDIDNRLTGGDVDVTTGPVDSNSTSQAEGGASDASITMQRQAPNIYNLAGSAERDCGIVFGLSGSNTTGGWAFGIPVPRSWTPTCDLWQASREAKENGHGWTSYFFMCQIKTIRKVWTDEGCEEIRVKAMDELGLLQPPMPELSRVYDQAANEPMMAQVAQDAYDEDEEARAEQHELVEYRQAQQQNKIDSLEQRAEDFKEREAALAAEVERLRIEAEKRELERESSRSALAEGLAKYQVKKNE